VDGVWCLGGSFEVENGSEVSQASSQSHWTRERDEV